MEIRHQKLSEAIIGCSMKVLNTLRPGLDEKVYENAPCIELRKRGHQVDQQKRFDVLYEGHSVGTFVPDLIIGNTLIADPKVVEDVTATRIAQMIDYLAITGLQLALLLNFKFPDRRWKRVVR